MEGNYNNENWCIIYLIIVYKLVYNILDKTNTSINSENESDAYK